MQVESIVKILELLLNTQMIWMIFMKTLKEYNPNKECKMLIVFDDMIADTLSNKKINPVVTELFIEN